MGETFIGPVNIDGSPASNGLLRVNGPSIRAGIDGKGPKIAKKLVGPDLPCGEIECGRIRANGDGAGSAASFGGDVGVDGDLEVSGNITVKGSVTVDGTVYLNADLVAAKIAEIDKRLHFLSDMVRMRDGEMVWNAVANLQIRVAKLE